MTEQSKDGSHEETKKQTMTYYINPEGDDRANGNEKFPLCTISRALELAVSVKQPVQIVLQPGIYTAFSLSEVCGTPDQPIVIRGQNPVPVDFTLMDRIDPKRMDPMPAREALDNGTWQLQSGDGLAVIEGNEDGGAELCGCKDLVLKDMVFYNAHATLRLRSCRRVTVADCVMTGEPQRAVHGILFSVEGPEDQPSREVQLERILTYNLKECGIVVEPGALFDSCWESCIAHSMQSSGGDGFSFLHVLPTDQPGAHPNRSNGIFPDGVEYNITMRRCLALRNRLDGFDIGQGVGGITLDMCIGDGNGWGEWYAKDLKVWSGKIRVRHTRMTGRTLFVSGAAEMVDFKLGSFDMRVGYGSVPGAAFAVPLKSSPKRS